MRPIKFRGRYSDCDLTFGADLKHISLVYPFDENSVKQFVGYDRDGNEVYEGDLLIAPDGHEFCAKLFSNVVGNETLKEVRNEDD